MKWLLVILLAGADWAMPVDLTYPTKDACEREREVWQGHAPVVTTVCLPTMSIDPLPAVKPRRRR